MDLTTVCCIIVHTRDFGLYLIVDVCQTITSRKTLWHFVCMKFLCGILSLYSYKQLRMLLFFDCTRDEQQPKGYGSCNGRNSGFGTPASGDFIISLILVYNLFSTSGWFTGEVAQQLLACLHFSALAYKTRNIALHYNAYACDNTVISNNWRSAAAGTERGFIF